MDTPVAGQCSGHQFHGVFLKVIQTMDKTECADNTDAFIVGATFDTATSADIAVEYLTGPAGFQRRRIELRPPAESRPRARPEAGKRRSGPSLGKLHVGLVIGCLALGSLLALMLLRYGPPALRSSPPLIVCAAGFFCLLFGFVVTMVLSLRSEPGSVLPAATAQSATPLGTWLVIVHCSNEAERDHATTVIGHSARLL
jgi:hypothetical protein